MCQDTTNRWFKNLWGYLYGFVSFLVKMVKKSSNKKLQERLKTENEKFHFAVTKTNTGVFSIELGYQKQKTWYTEQKNASEKTTKVE